MKSDMESNYKRLGDYITEVDVRNTDSAVSNLIGVSISKTFMDSVANVIGTDLSKYKVIKKGQFACNLMHVSRDGGIAISLYKEDVSAIMSPAYFIFEVTSKDILPEYLELIFLNPEFDREAVFNAICGIRGTLTWDDFCEMKIKVPTVTEQHNIIEYHEAIQNRLNSISNIESKILDILKVYLTENLEDVSDYVLIRDYCDKIQSGATPSRTNTAYWENPTIPWVKNGEVKNNIILNTEESISEEGLNNSSAKIIRKGSVLLAMYCVSTPQLAILNIDAATNQAVCCMTLSSEFKSLYLYYYLMFFGQGLTNIANGSAQQNLDNIHNLL